MLGTIITALLPIVVTLMLGYFAGREGNFNQDQAAVFNRMVMLYALPLLLFAGILGMPMSEITRNTALFVWITIGMVCPFVLVLLVSRLLARSSIQLAALRALAIAGPAVPFVGTSVLGTLYPSDADLAVAAGSMLLNLIQVPLALMFLVGEGNTAGAPRKSALATMVHSIGTAVRQPVVWAPMLAFILLLLGLDMPPMLKGSFMLLGQSTGGVALFAVGVVLYAQKVIVSVPVIINVVSKNLVVPGLILLAMLFFGVPADERGLVVSTLAIPSASIAVIFAVQFRYAEREMASTLFWSTILSIFTMGVFIWITG